MDTVYNFLRFWDFQIYLFFHDAIHDRPWLNASYLFFAKYGVVLIVLSFIYLIIRKKINAFICSFVALGVAFFIDTLIVMTWKRPRPFVAHSDEILRPITDGLRVSSFSFPSVHTYICFAIATSVFLYGHKRLGLFLFFISILVAIGRVGAGLHYPSDIIAGALLGIASGVFAYLVVSRAERNWESNEV